MTDTQWNKIQAGAYYMTQYATYMTDQGFYETLAESLPADIDFDRLAEWLNMTTDAPDRLNQTKFSTVSSHCMRHTRKARTPSWTC